MRWRCLADDNWWGTVDFGNGVLLAQKVLRRCRTLARRSMVDFGGGKGLGAGHARGCCRGTALSLDKDALIRGQNM
eukprot:5082332-Ditylum_brightwellii.AAC.1